MVGNAGPFRMNHLDLVTAVEPLRFQTQNAADPNSVLLLRFTAVSFKVVVTSVFVFFQSARVSFVCSRWLIIDRKLHRVDEKVSDKPLIGPVVPVRTQLSVHIDSTSSSTEASGVYQVAKARCRPSSRASRCVVLSLLITRNGANLQLRGTSYQIMYCAAVSSRRAALILTADFVFQANIKLYFVEVALVA